MQGNGITGGSGGQAAPAVKTLRCGSWCAVSSEEQAAEGKSSMGLQAEGNRAFVEAEVAKRYAGHVGVVSREYAVEGTRDITMLSEAMAMYPDGYGALVKDLKERRIDLLVCKEMSRLGRSVALLTTVQEEARKNGVLVVTLDAPPATLDKSGDTAALLMPLIQNGVAGVERANLLKRTFAGREARVTKKRMFGSKPPYGYRYDWQDGKAVGVVIEPVEAKWVRRALVDWYVGEGLSTPQIADRLNEAGAPTPSSSDKWDVFDTDGNRCRPAAAKWSFIAVVALIRRAHVYAGAVEYNRNSGNAYKVRGPSGEVIVKRPEKHAYVRAEGAHPPILTAEEAAAVEAEAESRTFKRRTRLYSGCTYCAHCGKPMVGTSVVSGGKRMAAMGCYGGRQGRGGCNSRIHDDTLTAALMQALDVLEATPDDQLETQTVQDKGRAEALQAVDQAQKTLAELDAQLSRVQNMEIAGRLTEAQAEGHHKRIERDKAKAHKALEAAGRKVDAHVDVSRRAERIAEVRASARELLAHAESDPDVVGQWLRKHVRFTVYRRDAGKGLGLKRVRVEFI